MRRMLQGRRRPFVVVVALSWLGAVLAGCSGSDPAPAPTSRHPGTAGTSTTTTPSADPTDVAAAAAIAAVKKLYAEYNAMLRSGASVRYRETFAGSCSYCVGNANRVDRIQRLGERIEGGSVRLTALRVADVQSDVVVVEGIMTDSPARTVKGDRVIERFAGGSSARFTWNVKPARGHWLVAAEQALK